MSVPWVDDVREMMDNVLFAVCVFVLCNVSYLN